MPTAKVAAAETQAAEERAAAKRAADKRLEKQAVRSASALERPVSGRASGAAAAVASERGITVTLLLPDSVPASSPHEQGLWAFVERFAATANATSTSKGVSFRLLTQSAWRHATTP